MTIGNTDKSAAAKGLPAPAPLALSKLRDHFRQTYLLDEKQVETMVVSSSKSLELAFSSAGEIFKGTEPAEQLVAFLHGLKGLLLNMGESELASYTKAVEGKLAVGEQLDYAMVIGIIEKGLVEILCYDGGNGGRSGFSGEVRPVQVK